MQTQPALAQVGVIMGSKSDWDTMRQAVEVLKDFDIPFEAQIVSAHRTPEKLFQYATSARQRGIHVIIAGAGGAAHLPGMVASMTTIPVIGVPVQTKALQGLDSLLSIVQMPGGVPVATVAIGASGAKNAGLLAVSILSLAQEHLAVELETFREKQTQQVLADTLE